MSMGTLGAVLALLTAGPTKDMPTRSGDVVQVALEQGSIADGLESFYVKLTVAKGWHVYANPVKAKAPAGPATVVKFLIDGKPADYNDIYYPKGVARKGPDGEEYRAYEGTVYFTGWLVYTDTKDAQAVSVRVKVVATDGKRHLKESVVVSELKCPEKNNQGDCSARAGDEARKKAGAAMLKKLTGTWELERPGRKPSKFAQNGDLWWDIDPDLIVVTCHGGQTEQFQHKPFLDTSKNPMWLDLLYLTDQDVALGIFKLEGDRLIYLEGKHYPVKEWQKAKGNLPGRPKDFNVKKGDEDRKQVLLRSAPPVPEKTVKP